METSLSTLISPDPIPPIRVDGSAARSLELVRGDDHFRSRASEQQHAEGTERVVNVTLAVIALLLLSPLLLLIALAVKLTSPGPILYTQTRIGIDRRLARGNRSYDRRAQDLGGSVFTIYKFRTMRVDAERKSGAVWATRRDPRVTPIGRFLRASRLDELPQLFNVVLGDMNIVGPRPERPGIFARLRTEIEEYPLRQLAKPGITGWAQINHTYDACVEDVRQKVRYDLEYIDRRSLAEDVRIMLKTVPVMLLRRGGW
jgi:lipopolysaccharide/colanic/teichoic acid biosynthesis glycosyltransferase